MMTKKDYIAFCDALARAVIAGDELGLEPEGAITLAAGYLANYFEDDNPAFDRKRFHTNLEKRITEIANSPQED